MIDEQLLSTQAKPGTWTILLFVEGRNDVRDRATTMQNLVKSLAGHGSPNVNLLVQYVTYGNGMHHTHRFAIPRDTKLELVPPPPPNSEGVANPDRDGGGATVAEYLEIAKSQYPAEHYGLVFLARDGDAPTGLRILTAGLLKILSMIKWLIGLLDRRNRLTMLLAAAESNLSDWLRRVTGQMRFLDYNYTLTMTSLATHLQATNGIKPAMIVLDACSMATVETIYELRHVTDWIIASPCDIHIQTEDVYKTWIRKVVSCATPTPAAIAAITHSSLYNIASPRGPLLLIETTWINDLAQATAALGSSIESHWNDVRQEIVDARSVRGLHDGWMCDLDNFVENLLIKPRLPREIRDACLDIQRCMPRVVKCSLDNKPCPTNSSNSGNCQLTVYFPDGNTQRQREYDSLAFTRCHPSWSRFLDAFQASVDVIPTRRCLPP